MKTPAYFANLAQSAYTTAPDIGIESGAARIVKVRDDAGVLFYSIPGTNNETCALVDIDATPFQTLECGFVHKGIWQAFAMIFDQIVADATKEPPKVVIGHSEGASGAIYVAAKLCLSGMAPREVWAFEPPHQSIDPVLRNLFARFGVKVHIFRHGSDPVPMLPPAIEHAWQHCAGVIQFGKNKSIFPSVPDHLLANLIPELPAIPTSEF